MDASPWGGGGVLAGADGPKVPGFESSCPPDTKPAHRHITPPQTSPQQVRMHTSGEECIKAVWGRKVLHGYTSEQQHVTGHVKPYT
jgi:hypothetical protein